MTKFFGRTVGKTIAIGSLGLALWGAIAAGTLKADPSDDLSFSLQSPQRWETFPFHVISETRVQQILGDRLDLFPKSQLPKLSRHLIDLCREYRFDPAFVLAMIEIESSFRIKAVSPAGAVGLMQLMPATAQVIGRTRFKDRWGKKSAQEFERILRDPFVNLEFGVSYLAFLRDRYQGLSPYYLVAAYNVGPARMDELLSRKDFKPVNTKRYYDSIRKALHKFRYYKRPVETQPI